MNKNLETFQRNIRRLSELASEWQPTEDTGNGCGPPKAFDIDGGAALIWTLHERPSVFIGKCYMPPNSVLPLHTHNAKEVLVIFEGGGVHESADVIKECEPGACVAIEGEKPHKFTAGPDGVWFSVTTVPREEGLSND